jgi:hypothetical protein
MKCKKCGNLMKCNGVGDNGQSWICEVCGETEVI